MNCVPGLDAGLGWLTKVSGEEGDVTELRQNCAKEWDMSRQTEQNSYEGTGRAEDEYGATA